MNIPLPSAISKALNDVFFTIPRELLEMAFMQDRYSGYMDNRSLEERINDTVIRGKVLQDCNLATGQMVTIPLQSLTPSQTQSGWFLQIPPHLTNGRRITNVFAIEYGYADQMAYGQNIYQGGGGHAFSDLLRMFETSVQGPASTGTPWVTLVGPNTILIRDISRWGNLFLRCMIEHDANLNNVSTSAYQTFSDLVQIACKIYIYTRLSIRIGEGAINGGSLNGYLRSALDEYSGMQEQYEEKMLLWRKVAAFSDRKTYDDILNMQMRF